MPLRSQFSKGIKAPYAEANNILITSGGTDNYHVIKEVLLEMEQDDRLLKTSKKVILGKFFDDSDWINDYANRHKEVALFSNVSDMAALMKSCDIAISAGGTTIGELCACGIPTVAFSIADNQLPSIHAYVGDNMIIYAGDIRENMQATIRGICNFSKELIDDFEKRKGISIRASTKIDGLGAQRISEAILNL